MDARGRLFSTLPSKRHEFTTKKAVIERRSYPPCPPLPPKVLKKGSLDKSLFSVKDLPKPVYFTKPVSLSQLYNKNKDQMYLDQIFATTNLIGEGSFGVVYKVESREDHKLYAIKQLKSSHKLKYAYAEVANCEKVGDHKNCVKFYMAWEEVKVVHIQMEYCQMSLAQYAIEVQNIPEVQLWEILFDILCALEFLHGKHLIHLDVKPGNIMISRGFYKLTDFGLLVDLNKSEGKKVSTISDGDAKYLACEVLNGVYLPSCDIFGLGISIVELATNIDLPEFGPLWHQIRKDSLPSKFHNVVTSDFVKIIKTMMSINPKKRPSANKLLEHTNLKKIKNQVHKELPRKTYHQSVLDDPVFYNYNNNIVVTPRRPLYEVRNSFGDHIRELSMDSSKSPEDSATPGNGSPGMSSTRRGLSRVKLSF